MILIYILLIIIAIGVLLLSAEGKKIINYFVTLIKFIFKEGKGILNCFADLMKFIFKVLIILLSIAGIVYVSFIYWSEITALLSKATFFVQEKSFIISLIILIPLILYYFYSLFKKIKSGEITKKTIKNNIKKSLYDQGFDLKRKKKSSILIISLISVIIFMILFVFFGGYD